MLSACYNVDSVIISKFRLQNFGFYPAYFDMDNKAICEECLHNRRKKWVLQSRWFMAPDNDSCIAHSKRLQSKAFWNFLTVDFSDVSSKRYEHRQKTDLFVTASRFRGSKTSWRLPPMELDWQQLPDRLPRLNRLFVNFTSVTKCARFHQFVYH